jgi:hypothetical protein
MSIVKTTLSAPWGSGAPSNLADPGGINDGGMPSGAKSIPRRWLNWILNKVDTQVRYLLGRGVPDYDSWESYSVGDRMQCNDGVGLNTYKCIVASVGDGTGGNSPVTAPTYWIKWGFTAGEIASWTAAITTITVTPASSGDAGTTGNATVLSIPFSASGGPGFKLLAFKQSDVVLSGGGLLDVALTGAAAFSAIHTIAASGMDDYSYNASSPVCKQTGANAFRITIPAGYALGSHPSIAVQVIGLP